LGSFSVSRLWVKYLRFEILLDILFLAFYAPKTSPPLFKKV